MGSVESWNYYGVRRFYTDEFLNEMLEEMYEKPTWFKKRIVKKELKKMDEEIRKNYGQKSFTLDFRKVNKKLAFNRVDLYMKTRDDLMTFIAHENGTYSFCPLMG